MTNALREGLNKTCCHPEERIFIPVLIGEGFMKKET